jgi:hypothetical protein
MWRRVGAVHRLGGGVDIRLDLGPPRADLGKAGQGRV